MKTIKTKAEVRAVRAKKYILHVGTAVVAMLALTVPALADDPVLPVISNFSTVMFAIVRAVGGILALWGIVQIALSLSQQNAQQRSIGIMELIGGLLVIFAKELLELIGAM
jgi:hypothetical protein